MKGKTKDMGKKRQFTGIRHFDNGGQVAGSRQAKKQKRTMKDVTPFDDSNSDVEDNIGFLQAKKLKRSENQSKIQLDTSSDDSESSSEDSNSGDFGEEIEQVSSQKKRKDTKIVALIGKGSSERNWNWMGEHLTNENKDIEGSSSESDSIEADSDHSSEESDFDDAKFRDATKMENVKKNINLNSSKNLQKSSGITSKSISKESSSSSEPSSEISSEDETDSIVGSRNKMTDGNKTGVVSKTKESSDSESDDDETDLESSSEESDVDDNSSAKHFSKDIRTMAVNSNKNTSVILQAKRTKQISAKKNDPSSSPYDSSNESSEESETDEDVKSANVHKTTVRAKSTLYQGNKQEENVRTLSKAQEVSDSETTAESDQESEDGSDDDDSDEPDVKNQTVPRGKKKHGVVGPEAGEDKDMEDEYAAIKKELANIPLEDLVKIKEKLGLKVFSQIMHGGKFQEKKKARVFKRENKNRPMEMSSKRPVPIIKQNMAPKKRMQRDPRFDDLSGEYSEQHFSRNYSFIDGIKDREKQLVKRKLKETEDESEKKDLQFLLNRMSQQQKEKERKKKKQELEAAWRQKEKELVKEGKAPYFLKKAEKKKLLLAEKFRELKESGKMDQYLRKKNKKNAQKERRKLPRTGRPAY